MTKEGGTLCTVRILGIPNRTTDLEELPIAARKVVCDFLEKSSRLTRIPVYVDVDFIRREEEEITTFVDLLPEDYQGEDYRGLAVDINDLLRRFAGQTMPKCAMVQTIVQTIGGNRIGYVRWDRE